MATTIGSIVKNVAGGFINKTMSRLLGSGISTDSRIVNAKAKWSGRDSKKDWRVKLTIPNGSPLETYFFQNNAVLSPLYENKGVFWPLTPNMIIQHSANFNALAQTHNNYPFQAYQNSQVDQMNIIGEFPVQNQADAKHWVATVHFLRTITKMFFGADDNLKGNPPPILHLSGYGAHMFEKVPVIVNTFNVELRAGIDYISTQQGFTPRASKNPEWDKELAELGIADGIRQPKGTTLEQQLAEGEDATWAPTLSNISVLATPVYSRDTIKKFSLKKFASGELSRQEGIGFI